MEKKGLFERLLDFWKEKIGAGETKGIGFWNGTAYLDVSSPQKEDTVSTKQQERKRTFWEERKVLEEKEQESRVLEREKRLFLLQEENGQRKTVRIGETAEGQNRIIGAKEAAEEQKRTVKDREDVTSAEKRRISKLFTAEFFQEEGQAEAEQDKMGQVFLWEEPAEEKERRSILPILEGMQQEKMAVREEMQEMPKEKTAKKEEPRTEMPFDIEKLMQQMTKRLWEERESCGRRLRG